MWFVLIIQNVLTACDFDMKFTYIYIYIYILFKWEGTIKNTLSRKDKVIIFRDNVKYKYNRYLHKKIIKKK